MSAKISVIIPVYNMEDSIAAAVGSVCSQTYKDLEVIVVNDGSTDKTAAVLESLAADDDRIRIIHQQNGGVSNARNTGLAAATGEYISWLDGDDRMLPTAMETLMTAIVETGADMSLCNYENIDAGERLVRYERSETHIITGHEALIKQLQRDITQSLCFCLCPRNYFNGVHFPDGHLFEDVRNSFRMYLQADTVAIVGNVLLYERIVRPNSISHAKTVARRAESAEAYLIRQRELNAIDPSLEPIFVRHNAPSLLLSLRSAVLRDSTEAFKTNIETVKDVCGYFKAHKKEALGNRPGLLKTLEYTFMVSGHRLGFFLSRLTTMGTKSGTRLY
ncbi:MAG: glycosyltransferase [Clostridia bacterium]|nr:glycosyltransferase [Clostridia bacterium]